MYAVVGITGHLAQMLGWSAQVTRPSHSFPFVTGLVGVEQGGAGGDASTFIYLGSGAGTAQGLDNPAAFPRGDSCPRHIP